MHLQHPFYRFPFQFDAGQLQEEVRAFPESAWTRHPQAFKGNSALALISTDGGTNDDYVPPMRPTELLRQSLYLQQVLLAFKTVLGRARLMRLEPGCGVPQHFDAQLYWRTHARVHIPVVTHPHIRFHCENTNVHMAAGEAWTFDNWRTHRVDNPTDVRRIHLVFDTCGSSAFWAMARPLEIDVKRFDVHFSRTASIPPLPCETRPPDPIIAPGEIDLEMIRLAADAERFAGNDAAAVRSLRTLLDGFRHNWRCAWSEAGPTVRGGRICAGLLSDLEDGLSKLPVELRLASNGASLKLVMAAIVDGIRAPLSALRRPHTSASHCRS